MIESLVGATAEAVFGYLLEQTALADKVRARLGRDPERLAFRIALGRALERLAQTYPEWVKYNLFDQHFLTHRAVPLLARCLLRDEPPKGIELAERWAEQWGLQEEAKYKLVTQATPMASFFLAELEHGLRARPEFQGLFDSRALDAVQDATERTAVAAEGVVKGVDELHVAVSQLRVELTQVLKEASTAQAKALGSMSVSGDVIGSILVQGQGNIIVQNFVRAISQLTPFDPTGFENFIMKYLGNEQNPMPFGGRQKTLAELDQWLTDPGGQPYALIAAKAGRGKSAVLVRWSALLEVRKSVHVVFIPINVEEGTSSAKVVFAALAARLREIYGERIQWENYESEGWLSVARELLLDRIPPDGKRVVVILDGLDELVGLEVNHGLLPLRLREVSGVRMIVSARYKVGDINEQGWRARLWADGWAHLVRIIPLPHLDEAGLRNVLEEMGSPLSDLVTNAALIRELYRLTKKGDPLLVKLYVDKLRGEGSAVVKMQPEDLKVIKPGLKGYFKRWWDDQQQRWGKESLLKEQAVTTVLNLLASALAPLDRDTLLELLPEISGHRLDDVLAPLDRFLMGDGQKQGYIFNHPRLRSHFWKQMKSDERNECQKRFLEVGRETLERLNQRKIKPHKAPTYIVQYYGAHLKRAKAEGEAFFALISEGWMLAWKALEGTHKGFLGDVTLAWQSADELCREGGASRAVVQQVRAALCQASIVAHQIPPSLLVRAFHHGKFTPAETLSLVWQMPQEDQRYEALSLIAREKEPVPLLLSEAPVVAANFQEKWRGAQVLHTLARQLSEDEKPTILAEALDITREIENELERYAVLQEMADQLPKCLADVALDITSSIKDPSRRASVLASLAPLFEGERQQEVLDEALEQTRAIEDKADQVTVLSTLAPLFEGEQQQAVRDKARALTHAIEDNPRRVTELGKLAPLFEGEQQQAVLDEAHALTPAIEDTARRITALSSLAPLFAGEQRQKVLDEALKLTDAIQDTARRVTALSSLAPLFVGEQRQKVLDEARALTHAIKDTTTRVTALGNLALLFEGEQQQEVLSEALKLTGDIKDTTTRVTALGNLALLFEGEQQQEVLSEALKLTGGIEERNARNTALGILAPVLPKELVDTALLLAHKIEDESGQAAVLKSLASLPAGEKPTSWEKTFDEDSLPDALEAVRRINDDWERASALADLSSHLSGALLDDALEIVRQMKEERSRASALSSLAPRLPDRLLTEALKLVGEMEHEQSRIVALGGLAPYLTGLLATNALALTRQIEDRWSYTSILVSLLPRLPTEQQQNVLIEALELAQNIEDDWDRVFTWVQLLPLLSGEQQQKELAGTLEQTFNIEDQQKRDSLLAALAHSLWEAPSLSAAAGLWSETLQYLARYPRPLFLHGLSILLPPYLLTLGDEASEGARQITQGIQEICTWWP